MPASRSAGSRVRTFRAALRRTLSSLNKALAGEGIDADRESIEFVHSDQIWLDVVAFEGALRFVRDHDHAEIANCEACIVSLNEAVDLYRADRG